ncbi:hypothetical protein BaRGS_00037692, partial [Batillaria attramentaria]
HSERLQKCQKARIRKDHHSRVCRCVNELYSMDWKSSSRRNRGAGHQPTRHGRQNGAHINDRRGNSPPEVNQDNPTATVKVTCAKEVQPDQLKSFFEKPGIKVKLLNRHETCFKVQLKEADDVPRALAMSGEDLCNEAVRIDVAEPSQVHSPLKQTVCAECKIVFPTSFLQTQIYLVFPTNMGDWIQKRGSQAKELNKSIFFKSVNALLNCGGGAIFIHAETRILHFFDDQVDDTLMKMVPDDSVFEENFEQKVLDQNHVVFRVKPGHRPLSTWSFNTKLSLNKGLIDPNHYQMRRLLSKIGTAVDQAPDYTHSSNIRALYPAKRGERMRFQVPQSDTDDDQQKSRILWFHENSSIQAKALADASVTNGTGMLNYLWSGLKQPLPHFITAFSKQDQGGSVFLGIKEEKLIKPAWHAVENMEGLASVFETERIFWKTAQQEKNPKVLYFAKPEDAQKKEEQTGCFECEGVPLTEDDKASMVDLLKKNLEKDLLWYPKAPESAPVELKFHPVQPSGGGQRDQSGEKQLFIVEARVKKVPGICFQDKRGPGAFVFAHRDNPALKGKVRLTWDEWLKRHTTTTMQA